jgi:hypothetical protein
MAGRGYGVTMTTESDIRAMITAADERHNGRPRTPHAEKKAQEWRKYMTQAHDGAVLGACRLAGRQAAPGQIAPRSGPPRRVQASSLVRAGRRIVVAIESLMAAQPRRHQEAARHFHFQPAGRPFSTEITRPSRGSDRVVMIASKIASGEEQIEVTRCRVCKPSSWTSRRCCAGCAGLTRRSWPQR